MCSWSLSINDYRVLVNKSIIRGNASAIFFLRRDNRIFSTGGQLNSRAKGDTEDGCIASCVDWYGNARPIFLGERIFALMGYEIVEGTWDGERITERRRTNFTPQGSGD